MAMTKEEERALRQEAATPWDFFTQVSRRFRFNVDVAASIRNHKCHTFITEKQNALAPEAWVQTVGCLPAGQQILTQSDLGRLHFWCNPPFKTMQPWVEKMCQEVMRTPGSVGVMLGPTSNAPWLTEFCYRTADSIEPIYPRVQLIPPEGITYSTNMCDQVLIVWRYRPDFAYVAPDRNDHRAVWRPYRWTPEAKPKKRGKNGQQQTEDD